jgi:light-harvesting complex 1 beta chain
MTEVIQMADTKGSGISGLSEAEAKEFHGMFVTSFIAFTVVAIVAHFLAWQWRPWIPPAEGYSFNDTILPAAVQLTSMFT